MIFARTRFVLTRRCNNWYIKRTMANTQGNEHRVLNTVQIEPSAVVAEKLEGLRVEEGAPANSPSGSKGREKPAKAKPKPAPFVPKLHMIDLRVGQIVKCEKHADADSLYVEQMDIGEESGPRTVVSGLVKYIPLDEMQNRKVVCVCNLKPASMRGIKSYAMVLAASNATHDTVELVTPPSDAEPGDKVTWKGIEDLAPESVLNPKKKVWETFQPHFTTTDDLRVVYKDDDNNEHELTVVGKGICKVPSLKAASIS